MKIDRLLLSALLTSAAWLPSSAMAADDEGGDEYGDMEGDGAAPKKTTKAKKQAAVREITKGLYAKASVGGGLYLLDLSGWVSPGTALGLSVGDDFLDRETSSAAWEIDFFQGVHNGKQYETQILEGGACMDVGGGAPCVQGDLRTYTLAGVLEWSFYPTRRIGIGIRAGGGVLISPLLMEPDYYNKEVVAGTWGGVDPGYHHGPHPLGIGGPTFEYYTKLSHFSVGVDADVFYAVGFDLGANVTGNLKYTF